MTLQIHVHLKETKGRTKLPFMLNKCRQPFQEAAVHVYELSNMYCEKNRNSIDHILLSLIKFFTNFCYIYSPVPSDNLGYSLCLGCKLYFLKRKTKRLSKNYIIRDNRWRVIVKDQSKLLQSVACSKKSLHIL